MPKISVIMSVRNGEVFLPFAIDSILKQSFADFEFIIINDFSTDCTSEILLKYAQIDQRIKIFNNQTNLGLTKSLNFGLKQAKGEFIARMDADDISAPNRLKIQLDFLENNPKVALVGSRAEIIDETGKIIGQKNPPITNTEIKKKMLFNNQFIHSSLLIRKKILDELGVYNESFRGSQDYELILRIGKHYELANILEPLVKWRDHKNNIAYKSKRQKIDSIRARWWAITKYSYPKLEGLVNIIKRLTFVWLPLGIQRKIVAQFKNCQNVDRQNMKQKKSNFKFLLNKISKRFFNLRSWGLFFDKFKKYFFNIFKYKNFSFNLNSREYWNDKLSERGDSWRIEPYYNIIELLPNDKEFSVLDLGCALGDGCELLREKFPLAKITGIDISEVGIEKAIEKNKNKTIEYLVLDVLNDELPKKYDFIMIIETLEHFNDPFVVLDKCLVNVNKAVIVSVPYTPEFTGKAFGISEHRYYFNENTFTNYNSRVIKAIPGNYIIYEILPK